VPVFSGCDKFGTTLAFLNCAGLLWTRRISKSAATITYNYHNKSRPRYPQEQLGRPLEQRPSKADKSEVSGPRSRLEQLQQSDSGRIKDEDEWQRTWLRKKNEEEAVNLGLGLEQQEGIVDETER
jgi:hypothetical protein